MSHHERIGATAFPLYWPLGWKRTAPPFRSRSRFRATNVYREMQAVRAELERAHARDVIVSTNLQLRNDGIPYANPRNPEDPGVAVFFRLRDGGQWVEHVLACDRWQRPEENLRAVALHVAALRGQSRWGVGSLAQSFRGYAALPERAGARPAHAVLGLDPPIFSVFEVERAFKRRALECHPDHGGTREQWDELQAARSEAMRALGAGA